IKYKSFHENEIPNENMLEDSENLLESEGLLEDLFKSEESVDVLNEPEDMLEELEPEDVLEKHKIHTEFPNEAYTDLMVLVTRHKLNNKTGNTIIKFFNKHSNLITSSLPKNIVKG